MEPTGRFGGRASEKAGERDMAMDSFDGGPGSGPKSGGSNPDAEYRVRREKSYEEGRAAAKAGKEAHHNPYKPPVFKAGAPPSHFERHDIEWLRGHHAGKNEAGKDAQGTSELENEYNEGFDGAREDNIRHIKMMIEKLKNSRSMEQLKRLEKFKEELKRLESEGTDEYRDEAHENAELARGRREDEVQAEIGPTNEFREPVGIADAGTGRFGGRGSDKAGGRDFAMDPLTSKGSEIKSNMEKEYGPKKGEQVFYASANKGTIKGVHE